MNMAFSVISVLLASLAILVSADSSDFIQQVKSNLPNDDFEKIFATNIDSNDPLSEVDKANVRAIREFENILGVKLDQSTVQDVRNQARRLAEGNEISPELVFRGYSETVYNSLKQAGVLNDQNESELAQQFANELKKRAQSLSRDDNYETTIPALTGALAEFFKSLGLNTKDFAELEQKNFVDEIKKL